MNKKATNVNKWVGVGNNISCRTLFYCFMITFKILFKLISPTRLPLSRNEFTNYTMDIRLYNGVPLTDPMTTYNKSFRGNVDHAAICRDIPEYLFTQ